MLAWRGVFYARCRGHMKRVAAYAASDGGSVPVVPTATTTVKTDTKQEVTVAVSSTTVDLSADTDDEVEPTLPSSKRAASEVKAVRPIIPPETDLTSPRVVVFTGKRQFQ